MKDEMIFIIPVIAFCIVICFGMYFDTKIQTECYKASVINKELKCNSIK